MTLTPAARRRLVDAPLPTTRVIGRSYPWAGVLIQQTVPTEGHKTWHVSPEDEEWFHNHKRVDD